MPIIKVKRSQTAGVRPPTLDSGEIAANIEDGIFYLGKADGQIVSLGGGSVDISCGTTIQLDLNRGSSFSIALDCNASLADPTGGEVGRRYEIEIHQSGGFSLSPFPSLVLADGLSWAISQNAGDITIAQVKKVNLDGVSFICDNLSSWSA